MTFGCANVTVEHMASPEQTDPRDRHDLPGLGRVQGRRGCTDSCADAKLHAFYANGGGFRWRWPTFDRLNPADRRTRAGLNRYPHNVIGAYVVVFGHGLGLRWKGSQR